MSIPIDPRLKPVGSTISVRIVPPDHTSRSETGVELTKSQIKLRSFHNYTPKNGFRIAVRTPSRNTISEALNLLTTWRAIGNRWASSFGDANPPRVHQESCKRLSQLFSSKSADPDDILDATVDRFAELGAILSGSIKSDSKINNRTGQVLYLYSPVADYLLIIENLLDLEVELLDGTKRTIKVAEVVPSSPHPYIELAAAQHGVAYINRKRMDYNVDLKKQD